MLYSFSGLCTLYVVAVPTFQCALQPILGSVYYRQTAGLVVGIWVGCTVWCYAAEMGHALKKG